MEVLPPQKYSLVKEVFSQQAIFFPIIGAVLDLLQPGVVFVDCVSNPRGFFVAHRFGFSQCFFLDTQVLEVCVSHLVLEKDKRLPRKLRLYNPSHDLLSFSERYPSAYRSERIQWRLSHEKLHKVDYFRIDAPLYQEVEEHFPLELGSRFWSSKAQFLKESFGVVVKVESELASVCYAAALSQGIAEIDVFTLERYRRGRAGKRASQGFLTECASRGVTPNWDCYSNNEGSCALARALGFGERHRYPFLTIDRQAIS